jgi:hypothetical protein
MEYWLGNSDHLGKQLKGGCVALRPLLCVYGVLFTLYHGQRRRTFGQYIMFIMQGQTAPI